ncbi:MAG: hypothetical protein JSU73_11940, partial [candidate division WOR-3 bacterium]
PAGSATAAGRVLLRTVGALGKAKREGSLAGPGRACEQQRGNRAGVEHGLENPDRVVLSDNAGPGAAGRRF